MGPFASAWGAFTQEVGFPWERQECWTQVEGQHPRSASTLSLSAIFMCVPVSTPVTWACRLYYQITRHKSTRHTHDLKYCWNEKVGRDNAKNPVMYHVPQENAEMISTRATGLFISNEVKTMMNKSDLTGVTKKCTGIIYRLYETMGLCLVLILNFS